MCIPECELNSCKKWIKIVQFIGVNIELRSTRGKAAWVVICISITAHGEAQSNRVCNIFIFVVFGGFQSSLSVYFDNDLIVSIISYP